MTMPLGCSGCEHEAPWTMRRRAQVRRQACLQAAIPACSHRRATPTQLAHPARLPQKSWLPLERWEPEAKPADDRDRRVGARTALRSSALDYLNTD
jgi:hypothetical protein